MSVIGSCAALVNGSFKAMWAILLDYYNFKPVYSIVLGIQIGMLVLIHSAASEARAYAIVISLSFMCDGAISTMLPVVTNHVFGLTRGPAVYGYMYSAFGASAMSGTVFVKLFQGQIGYTGMLVICLALSLVSAVLTYLYQFYRIDYLEYFGGQKKEQRDEAREAESVNVQNKSKVSKETERSNSD